MISYDDFLKNKTHEGAMSGFNPNFMPDKLFDFQRHLVDWAVRKGRSSIFADCGLGKTPMQLTWAENIVKTANKPVLILTPLAVSAQTISEADKFDIEAHRSNDGALHSGINVTNYERLHYFNPDDFAGVVCDESSIMKNFDGARKREITEFMKKVPYRLLCTATAAPNDYIELGTSSEALGELGYTDMLTRFFKNDQNTIKPVMYLNRGNNFQNTYDANKWRLKGHAEIPFWQWVTSWARAVRKPSDLGFNDDKFLLPPLIEREHLVDSDTTAPGMLFSLPAVGLKEQREESRRTLRERCEKAAQLVDTGKQALMWCHLNDEGDLLDTLIPDATQISGSDCYERKEEVFLAFARGDIRVLVTKTKIGAWGLNFQKCSHVTFFPSHSFEQYYQGVRRCWRFGQQNPVTVDIVTTEGGKGVMANLQRKAKAADVMFGNLVAMMNQSLSIDKNVTFKNSEKIPSWL